MDRHSDIDLVAAVLAGDTESFGVLARRYQDRVYAVVLGVLADFSLAQDAAQEAFLCAYCELPNLREPQRFGPWLCGVARNTAFEVLRERMRRRALATRVSERVDRDQTAPPADLTAEQDEQRSLVQDALRKVNDKDREALTLYYVNGLSYAEICGFLGVSTGTLKGRLQRGRAALREELIMVNQACRDGAPDEQFARRLDQAIRVFGASGPARDHLPSKWHDAIMEETRRILAAGEEGLRIDAALSHSGAARQRALAASRFGLRRDPRSLEELVRMLDDRSARVRRAALKWYASRIHPCDEVTGPHAIGVDARVSCPGVDRLIERLSDENYNVRFAAVTTVAAYRSSGDPRVTRALQTALDDPKHKVRHAVARILGVACPGCGKTW